MNIISDRISIVTIVLNQKDSIEETIESVLSQEHVWLEYIVIDGGSTDGTLEIIEKYQHRIQHFRTGPDGGIYQAINKGIALASAPIVGLIHCGDRLKPGALSEVCKMYYQYDADVVYGDIEIAEELEQEYIHREYRANHLALKKRMSIFHPSTFVKKKIYDTVGGYDTKYKSAADYDFFLNLFINKYRFLHIPKVLAVFTAGGFSEKNYKLARAENYQIRVNRVGKGAAVRYWGLSALRNTFFSYRKKMLIGLFGKRNFDRVKILLKK